MQPKAQQSVALQPFDSFLALSCSVPSGSWTSVGSEKQPSGLPHPRPWLRLLEKLLSLSVHDRPLLSENHTTTSCMPSAEV